ncbi:hypothetical protein [Mesorhizobium sp.]|nr:hypothetical protein [Mesorhizobium sp.]
MLQHHVSSMNALHAETAPTGDSSRTDRLERQDDPDKSKKTVASRRQKVLKTVPIALNAARSSCARQGLMICCRFKENE